MAGPELLSLHPPSGSSRPDEIPIPIHMILEGIGKTASSKNVLRSLFIPQHALLLLLSSAVEAFNTTRFGLKLQVPQIFPFFVTEIKKTNPFLMLKSR